MDVEMKEGAGVHALPLPWTSRQVSPELGLSGEGSFHTGALDFSCTTSPIPSGDPFRFKDVAEHHLATNLHLDTSPKISSPSAAEVAQCLCVQCLCVCVFMKVKPTDSSFGISRLSPSFIQIRVGFSFFVSV